MAGLDRVVTENPGAVALLVVILLGISKAVGAVVIWLGKREVARVWEGHADHDERLGALEAEDSAHALILQELGYISKGLADLTVSVTEHNKEAEKWKRDIVGHSVRIKNLEGRR